MAWYDDNTKLTQVVTYKNDKDASRESEKAAQKGWTPQGTSAVGDHVNVGRTTAKILLLGLPFLVTGASRGGGKVTLTYVRTADWQAKHS
jgi:hypothetical protein